MFNNPTINLCRDGVPLIELHQATNWLARLRGLFAYPPLTDSQGLLIRPCNAVHTFGMKYHIDVVFLAKEREYIEGCATRFRFYGCLQASACRGGNETGHGIATGSTDRANAAQ